MKKIVSAIILAVLVALVPTGAFASEARAKYGSGYFTVGPATLPASGGCFDHPHRLDVNIGYETDGWFVAVTVNGPGGFVDGWTSEVYWDDWGASYFEETAFICSALDGPGTYTISGTLNSVNSGSSTVVEQPLTPTTFAVNPYVAPPPPPPPVVTPPPTPPVVYADVKGTVTKQLVTRGVKFTFKAKPIATGAAIRNKLKWTVIKDDKVTSFTQRPDTKRVKTFTFARGSGVHKLKVLRNGKVATKVTVRA